VNGKCLLLIVAVLLIAPGCAKKMRNDNLAPGADPHKVLAEDIKLCKAESNLMFPGLSRDERKPLDPGDPTGYDTTVTYMEDWVMDKNSDDFMTRCLRGRGWEQR
jgi:hypothetical protein